MNHVCLSVGLFICPSVYMNTQNFAFIEAGHNKFGMKLAQYYAQLYLNLNLAYHADRSKKRILCEVFKL